MYVTVSMPRCGCIGKPTIGPSIGSLKAKWSKSRKGSNGLARLGPNDRRSSTPAPSITNWGSMMSRAIRIRPRRKVALPETDWSHPYYIEAEPAVNGASWSAYPDWPTIAVRQWRRPKARRRCEADRAHDAPYPSFRPDALRRRRRCAPSPAAGEADLRLGLPAVARRQPRAARRPGLHHLAGSTR